MSVTPAVVPPFVLVGGRLWVDFANTTQARRAPGSDALRTFGAFVRWLEATGVLDQERAWSMRRRAEQQPAGAQALLGEARELRGALRALGERGSVPDDDGAAAREGARLAINRVLGRTVGVRRIEPRPDGGYGRVFAPGGDAFGALLSAVADSAADALVEGEFRQVRRCAAPACGRLFLDTSRPGTRRWCDMRVCGNRAKAARSRARGARA